MSNLLANDIFYNPDSTAHAQNEVIEGKGCQIQWFNPIIKKKKILFVNF